MYAILTALLPASINCLRTRRDADASEKPDDGVWKRSSSAIANETIRLYERMIEQRSAGVRT